MEEIKNAYASLPQGAKELLDKIVSIADERNHFNAEHFIQNLEEQGKNVDYLELRVLNFIITSIQSADDHMINPLYVWKGSKEDLEETIYYAKFFNNDDIEIQEYKNEEK